MPLIQISDDNPTGKAVSHFRNVKVIDWTGEQARGAVVNLGGGPRPHAEDATRACRSTCTTGSAPAGTPRSSAPTPKDFRRRRPDVPRRAAADRRRVARRRGQATSTFPKLLDPVDDLPPTTVITHVRSVDGRQADRARHDRRQRHGDEGAWSTASEAKAPRAELRRVGDRCWTTSRAGELKLDAHAEDAAGNVEKRPHVVVLSRLP